MDRDAISDVAKLYNRLQTICTGQLWAWDLIQMENTEVFHSGSQF